MNPKECITIFCPATSDTLQPILDRSPHKAPTTEDVFPPLMARKECMIHFRQAIGGTFHLIPDPPSHKAPETEDAVARCAAATRIAPPNGAPAACGAAAAAFWTPDGRSARARVFL